MWLGNVKTAKKTRLVLFVRTASTREITKAIVFG
jgi:hypothetical protein